MNASLVDGRTGRQRRKTGLLVLAGLLLAACGRAPGPTALSLSFVESGPEGDRPVRMLVAAGHLRIEDGDAASGFILLDRRTATVYSVSHADRSVLVLRGAPVALAPPARFEHRVEPVNEPLPPVAGRPVRHYRLFTNGRRCFEVYAADGLLPQAVAALRDYHLALAAVQAEAQARMPAAYQSDCDLAEFVFLPARHLEFGFPVRQVNGQGVTRQLIDYRAGVAVGPDTFALPADYREIAPGRLGGTLR